MYTSQQLLALINAYINDLKYDRQPYTLYEPIRYVLSLGGKRIRPTLMLLAYNMYKEHPQEILPAACAIETYHNYTLLHDDLMDKAPLRRGKPTVHEKWGANTAILSGDSMLVQAYQYLLMSPQNQLPALLDLFTETALQIGEGQQYDMDFEHRIDVSEAEYIEMIRLKTSVLLACALRMGAILGEASPQDASRFYSFGEQVGLAFQLQDDLLDVYGDPKTFGKTIGGDIVSNKKTYLLINALNLADEQQRKELLYWINQKDYVPEQKVKAVSDIYDNIGIPQMVENKIKTYFDSACSTLDSIAVADEKKQEMLKYISEMMTRNS